MDVIDINDRALEEFLREVNPKYRRRIYLSTLSMAGRKVIRRAKQYYKQRAKGYSKTMKYLSGYAVKPSRDDLCVYIGNTYYKARFLEKGTKDRRTKRGKRIGMGAYRGKIEPINTLSDALNDSIGEVNNTIRNGLRVSLERIIKKANSNAKN